MSARSVVLFYEDEYYDELHKLVKRLRKASGRGGELVLEPWSALGTGGFQRDLSRILRTPLKYPKAPPDLVICVGDADRPANLVKGALPSPDGPTARWVESFEADWKEALVKSARLTPKDAERVRTVVLRWNQESVLLSSPAALLAYARKHDREIEVRAMLAACHPSPLTLKDADFVDTYRHPDRCMDEIVRAIFKVRRYKKGRDNEDILRDHVLQEPERIAEIRTRCPDLVRLLEAIDPPAHSP